MATNCTGDFAQQLHCYNLAYSSNQVAENFVPPLLDAVLIDYQRNVPAAREPEVLSTMAIIVNKLGGHITAEIPQIFDAVFECTLNMINKVFIFKAWDKTSPSEHHCNMWDPVIYPFFIRSQSTFVALDEISTQMSILVL